MTVVNPQSSEERQVSGRMAAVSPVFWDSLVCAGLFTMCWLRSELVNVFAPSAAGHHRELFFDSALKAAEITAYVRDDP